MKNLSFKEIDWARKILELPEEATYYEIKKAYRELVKKYHPDKCSKRKKKKREEKIKEINKAYELIAQYCSNYKFSFRKKEADEFDREKVYKEHMDRFYDNWWGDIDKDK